MNKGKARDSLKRQFSIVEPSPMFCDSSRNTNYLDATSMYNSLGNLKFDVGDSDDSLRWADNHHIDDVMNLGLTKGCDMLAFYISPTNWGVNTEGYAVDLLAHICKRQTTDGNIINDHYSNELDRPFISIANTESVFATESNDTRKIGGIHWVSFVLLPKKYTSVTGKVIKNDRYEVYFFDSLARASIPEKLRLGLTEGIEHGNGPRLLPLCLENEISFHDTSDLTGQQVNSCDCGWWACYYALMTVYTGDVEFLRELKGKILSARPLRNVMNLQESSEYSFTGVVPDFSKRRFLPCTSLTNEIKLADCMANFSERTVIFFENKFLEYSKRLIERDFKEGKISSVTRKVTFHACNIASNVLLSAQNYVLGGLTSVASFCFSWLISSLSNIFQKGRTENLNSKIQEFCSNHPEIRLMLIEASMRIFMSYEEQFATTIDFSEKNHFYSAINDLADSTASRMIEYFRLNPESEFSTEGMVKAAVLGKSKRYRSSSFGVINISRGHSSYVNTNQFFDATGIKYGEDYYQLELDNFVEGFLGWGFRTIFPWEIAECTVSGEVLQLKEFPNVFFKKVEISKKLKYKYVITEKILKEKTSAVWDALKSNYWYITEDLKSLAKEVLDLCNKILKTLQDTEGPLQHTTDEEGVYGYQGRQIFLSPLYHLNLSVTSPYNCVPYTGMVTLKEELRFFTRRLVLSFSFFMQSLAIPIQFGLLHSEAFPKCKQFPLAFQTRRFNEFIKLMQSITFDNFKKLISESGIRLFQGFEKQIQLVKGCSSNAEIIIALCNCTVARMMEYISKSFNAQLPSCDFMVEAAVLGSLGKELKFLFSCGSNGQLMDANDIYDKTPVFLSERKIFSYSKDFVTQYGTRLPFNFEKEGSQSSFMTDKTFVVPVDSFSQQQSYDYVLQSIDIKEECNLIIKEILGDRVAQKSDLSLIMQALSTQDKKLQDLKDLFVNLSTFLQGMIRTSGDGRGPGSGGPGGGGPGSGGPGGGGPGSGGPGGGGPGGGGPGSGGPGGGGPGGGDGGSDDCSIDFLSEDITAISLLQIAEDGESAPKKRKTHILEPVRFGVRAPEQSFTGRKEELNDLDSKIRGCKKGSDIVTRMVIVSGLGGIGKTALVRKYVDEYCKDCEENVIWINGESKSSLQKSFDELAMDGRLGIFLNFVNGKRESQKQIIGRVYRFFANKESLFIFDNVDDIEGLVEFLPSYSLKPNNGLPCILITSRNQVWEAGAKLLKLGTLFQKDAILLVDKGLGKGAYSKSREKLGEELKFFPLAMQQAISYIQNKRKVDIEFSIDDYLDLYREQKEKMLSYPSNAYTNNDYFGTTLTTWQVTINEIQSDPENGKLAIEILNVIGYLESDGIRREMFLSLANGDESKLQSAVYLLVQYSMIGSNNEQTILDVHNLVQEVTRINLMKINKNEEFMERTLRVLEYYAGDFGSQIFYDKMVSSLQHSSKFLTHITGYLNKSPEESKQKIVNDYLIPLFSLRIDCYTLLEWQEEKDKDFEALCDIFFEYLPEDVRLGILLGELGQFYQDYRVYDDDQKELFSQARGILSSRLPNSLELARVLFGLGMCPCSMDEKNDLLGKAVSIFKKHLPIDFELLQALLALSEVHRNLGNSEQEALLLEEALKIKKGLYLNPFEFLDLMIEISNINGDLGNASKQRELLKEAFKIFEQNFIPSSIAVPPIIAKFAKACEIFDNSHIKGKLFYYIDLTLKDKRNFFMHISLIEIGVVMSNYYGSVLGDFREQRDLIVVLIKLLTKHYKNSDDLEVIKVKIGIANISYNLGLHKRCKSLFRDANHTLLRYNGNGSLEVVQLLIELGKAYWNLGELIKQDCVFNLALELLGKFCNTNSLKVAKLIIELSEAQSDLDRVAGRLRLLDMGLEVLSKYRDTYNLKAAGLIIRLCKVQCSESRPELLGIAFDILERYNNTDNLELTDLRVDFEKVRARLIRGEDRSKIVSHLVLDAEVYDVSKVDSVSKQEALEPSFPTGVLYDALFERHITTISRG